MSVYDIFCCHAYFFNKVFIVRSVIKFFNYVKRWEKVDFSFEKYLATQTHFKPPVRFELTTPSLQDQCSTTEL